MDITEVVKKIWTPCPDTTDGTITSGIKYRDWEVKPLNLYYKGTLVVKVIHNVTLVSDSVKFLIPSLVKVHHNFFVIPANQFAVADSLFDSMIARFAQAANHSYFIPNRWFRILKSSDYRYNNKYLDYCLTLDYAQFCSAASKHRQRQQKDVKEISGLWYV